MTLEADTLAALAESATVCNRLGQPDLYSTALVLLSQLLRKVLQLVELLGAIHLWTIAGPGQATTVWYTIMALVCTVPADN